MELQKEPLLTINPRDAERNNIANGDDVILETPHGKMRVKTKPTVMVPEGVVGIMHGWSKANVNELIPRQFDPISGFPPYKEVICKVEKAL